MNFARARVGGVNEYDDPMDVRGPSSIAVKYCESVRTTVCTELNELESHRGHTLLSKSLGHQHWVYTGLGRSCAVASLLLPVLSVYSAHRHTTTDVQDSLSQLRQACRSGIGVDATARAAAGEEEEAK